MNANYCTSITYRSIIDLNQLVADRTHQRWMIPQSAQNSRLGTLQRLGANVHYRPIEHAAILFRRKRKDLHMRIPAKQKAALGDVFVGVVERENQDVGLGFLDRACEFALIPDFANHLDIGLVGDYCQDELPHQSWTVCNQNSHSFHEHHPRQNTSTPLRKLGQDSIAYSTAFHKEGYSVLICTIIVVLSVVLVQHERRKRTVRS